MQQQRILSIGGLVAILMVLIAAVDVDGASSRRRRPLGTKENVKTQDELYPKSKFCVDRTNDWGIPYRYYRPTKRCYLVGEKGPCGELMEFTLQDNDYGYCDCDQSLRCGRPLIFWPDDKRCYFVNDQGPCTAGRWLVFGYDNTPVCRKNNCLSKTTPLNTSNAVFGNQFWFEKQGKCYRTGSQGYCKSPEEVLVNKWNDYRPTCSILDSVKCGGNSFVHKMECLPGMKMDYYDKCVEKLVRNRTREAERLEEEEAKKKATTPAYHPYYERFPEDDRIVPVYSLFT